MVDELLAALRSYAARGDYLQCEFVHSKKGKRCWLRAAPGCRRCKTHLETDGDRVQCPLDPSHTVERIHLERHLATACPSLRDAQFLGSLPFYRAGVNCGPTSRPHALPDVGLMSRDRRDAWIERIEAVFPQAVSQALGKEARADAKDIVNQSMSDAAGGELGHADKHGLQNLALSQLASELCGDRLSRAVMVEYGCGRGALSLSLLRAHPQALSVLVDRDTRRHRVEQRRDVGHEVLRLRMDIADFDLGALLWDKVPDAAARLSDSFARCERSAQRSRRLHSLAELLRAPPFPPPGGLLVCAKHLCGSGTDLALRSLRGATLQPLEVGLCCATCCHHRCDPDTYVNPAFLASLGLTEKPADFAEFLSAAGWAAGAVDLRLRRAGIMAKRILDYGRVAWLRSELGFSEATLVSYVSKDVTPENMAIVFNGISAVGKQKEPVSVRQLPQYTDYITTETSFFLCE
eukprot:s531_g10.t1